MQKMFELPEELLEKLKCSQCEGYLSTSPVLLRRNGDNICGKCAIPSNSAGVRNKVYEELAACALFPCQYQERGCKEKLCFEEIKYHELGCKHRKYVCPVSALQNCMWSDNLGNLKQHFEDNHQELLVDHPYKFKPNILNDNETWLLMEVLTFLFLVQIKCNVAAAKLWFCIRFVGNPKFADLFEFRLYISNNDTCFIQKQIVQSFEGLLLSRNKVLEIDTNSILTLVTDFQNIFCTISVKLKNEFCSMCSNDNKLDAIRLTNKGYTCYYCSCKVACKYQHKGCTYKDIKMNILKHQLWLCPFSKSLCTIDDCNNNLSNYKNLIDHLCVTHCRSKIIQSAVVNSTDIVLNRRYWGCIKAYNSIFIRDYCCDGITLYYKIISNLSKQETKNYKCTLVVYNTKTGYVFEKEMKCDLKSLEYDWFIEVTNNKNNSFIRKKQFGDSVQLVYSCEMKIDKICN